jgi:hypothetical protein
LSKICTLQLRGWLQRVWEEGVWVISYYTLRVKGIICNSDELGNDNRGKFRMFSRLQLWKVLCP